MLEDDIKQHNLSIFEAHKALGDFDLAVFTCSPKSTAEIAWLLAKAEIPVYCPLYDKRARVSRHTKATIIKVYPLLSGYVFVALGKNEILVGDRFRSLVRRLTFNGFPATVKMSELMNIKGQPELRKLVSHETPILDKDPLSVL